MVVWNTRMPESYTATFGVGELHMLCFEPPGWRGAGETVTLGIPECEVFYARAEGTGIIVETRRAPENSSPDVPSWIHTACKVAADNGAFLIINCDTAEQATAAADLVEAWLPATHRRVAIERMRDPASRAMGGLN